MTMKARFTSLELCAGAGGQALGLEHAGFSHLAAVELDQWAHKTLLLNRPEWHPVQADIRDVRGKDYKGVDLLAGGVPCPPFSVAGRQLGAADERDLFPAALEWISEAAPKAVMLENVPGLASPRFIEYRSQLFRNLHKLGFSFCDGKVLNAASFGVSQLRPRYLIIALRARYADAFEWPSWTRSPRAVGDLLYDLMSAGGWKGSERWRDRAAGIAPTLVGGSKLHGGPDLGPTRAKVAWKQLGVDGHGLADAAPGREFPTQGLPKLTVRMTARLQGFPDDWRFEGRKTASYRQVGNAFPPPVAAALGSALRDALERRPARPAQARLFAALG